MPSLVMVFIEGYHRPRSEGDNALGSVRLSVCLSVCPSVSTLMAKPFYQSEAFVCVSVISWRIRIIARMRSIGVLIVTDGRTDATKYIISRLRESIITRGDGPAYL